MKTQLEFLKEAVALAEADPDLEIIVGVASDEVCEDSFWSKQQIIKVEKVLSWTRDENIFTGLKDIMEEMEYFLDRQVTEEEILKQSKEVIMIYTNA
jgi:hypothetical protein